MNTRKYADRYEAKRLLRSPVYQDVHARHVAQVSEIEAALRKHKHESADLKKKLEAAEASLNAMSEKADDLKAQLLIAKARTA